MTNHPRVWRYMRWCPQKVTNCKECAYGCLNITHDEKRKPVDGNDMEESINRMVKFGDWEPFVNYANNKSLKEHNDTSFVPQLISPDRFFDLLELFLEEREKSKKTSGV